MFFDYIFYRVFGFYKNKWKSDIPAVYAICVIVTCQVANVVAIGFVLSEYVFHELILSKWIIGILFFFLLSINGLRYKVPSVYEKKYQDETDAEKKRKGYGVLLYILLSLAMVIITPLVIRSL